MSISKANRDDSYKKSLESIPKYLELVYSAFHKHQPCTDQAVANFTGLSLSVVNARRTELANEFFLLKEFGSDTSTKYARTLYVTVPSDVARMRMERYIAEMQFELEELTEGFHQAANVVSQKCIGSKIEKINKKLSKLKTT